MAELRKYDAFISYRHSELDKFVATTLQRKLETFTLPKGVTSKTGKKRIERVFRDQDELPLSSNLSEPIHLALNNTDFLIVICTPRLPESKWCEEEISTFINLYGREKILAVLAEGEPSESFPPLLTGEDYEETLPDGSKVTNHRSFEPLAADVRGKNNKEIRKKLDDAVLRIAASIFELNYDDLKQRHRERKIRRMFSVISSVAAAFMLFSAVCIGLMAKIMNQSTMIMEQNKEITEKNNEIQKQNALIEQQYQEASRSLALMTAQNIDNLLGVGRRDDALFALRQVMPDSVNDSSIPYTEQAQEALCKALGVYDPNALYRPNHVYESDSSINDMLLSPDSKKLAILSSDGKLDVYDTSSYELLGSFKSTLNYGSNTSFLFADNDKFYYNDGENIHQYTFKDKKDDIISFYEDETTNSFSFLKPSVNLYTIISDSSYFVATRKTTIYLINSSDNSIVKEYDLKEYYPDINSVSPSFCQLSSDKKYLAFEVYSGSSRNSLLTIFDITNDEKVFEKTFDSFSTSNLALFSDHIFIYAYSSYDSGFTSGSVYTIDCEKGSIIWNHDTDQCPYFLTLSPNHDELLVSCYTKAYSFDLNNGNLYNTNDSGTKIVFPYTSSMGYFEFILQNGTDCVFNYYDDSPLQANTFSIQPTSTINKLLVQRDIIVILFNNEDFVSQYTQTQDRLSLCINKEEQVKMTNYDGTKFMLAPSQEEYKYAVYDAIEGKVLSTTKNLDSEDSFVFVGDGNQFIAQGNQQGVKVYDYTNNTLKVSIDKFFIDYSNDYNYVLCSSNSLNKDSILEIYSLEDGKLVSSIDFLTSNNFFDYEYYLIDNNHIMVFSENDMTVSLYSCSSDVPLWSVNKYIKRRDSIVTCDFDSSFCIISAAGTAEYYKIIDNTVVLQNTLYNYNLSLDHHLIYYKEKHMYLISCTTYSFFLNEDFVPTEALSDGIIYLLNENSFFYVTLERNVYKSKYYSYDELIQMADEQLNGYTPSEKVKKRYNITVREK